MFNRLSVTILSVLVMAILAGCSLVSPTSAYPAPQPAVTGSSSSSTYPGSSSEDNYQMLPFISGGIANLKLDAGADGTTQQLKVGEVMAITLASNPSTGYAWFAVSSNNSILAQLGEPQYQQPTSETTTPMVGAPGSETLYFQAISSGTATLTLEYRRSWETNVSPGKTIQITVEVK